MAGSSEQPPNDLTASAATIVLAASPPQSVEESLPDSDSGFDEASLPSEMSLTSSAYVFEEEHGRTYHSFKAEKKFVLPNDEAEIKRMYYHHQAFRLAIGSRMFYAPVNNPSSVLDVGTGSGLWAVEVADAHPSAQVIGIDLSPIQETWVPPNLKFLVEDLEEEWYGLGPFDLVHTRGVNCVGIKDWPKFFQQAFASIRPGGWVECQEFNLDIQSDDSTIPEDGIVRHWANRWEEGLRRAGLTGRCYPGRMVQQMQRAGFTSIQLLSFKMPIGPWPEELTMRQAGLSAQLGLLEGIHGMSARVFTQHLESYHPKELEVLLAHVRTELNRGDIHSYVPVHIVYGQRPPLEDIQSRLESEGVNIASTDGSPASA